MRRKCNPLPKCWAFGATNDVTINHCTMLITKCGGCLMSILWKSTDQTSTKYIRSMQVWDEWVPSTRKTTLFLKVRTPSILRWSPASYYSSQALRSCNYRRLDLKCDQLLLSNLLSLPGASWFFKYKLTVKYVISYDKLSNGCLPSVFKDCLFS